MMKETPYELLEDNQKKKLGKNNEAKLTLYNALPRKEYKRVFMCKTAKEDLHTLIITHQCNLQVKNYKIDLLTQEYEKFSISNEEAIDSGFTRFNAKDLATLPLDELVGNLKVYEMILENDERNRFWHGNQFGNGGNRFGRGRGNSIGNKGGEISKPKRACYNYGIEGHFASECKKPKENKAFVRGAWSDSEDNAEQQNDAACLVVIDS
nr:hypothetical protein [Tanacetum cinerariifolium]